jgi:hypothetical protein
LDATCMKLLNEIPIEFPLTRHDLAIPAILALSVLRLIQVPLP